MAINTIGLGWYGDGYLIDIKGGFHQRCAMLGGCG